MERERSRRGERGVGGEREKGREERKRGGDRGGNGEKSSAVERFRGK